MTTHQGRLLILDDDPAIGRTIGFAAESIGFEARVVSRPGPFLRELDIWAPTHIALDLIMPEMDGVEVVRLLAGRSEEHTSELQSLMRISYAVFCLKKKTTRNTI